MDRVITLDVAGYQIRRRGETLGATGTGNAVLLRLSFDDAWDGMVKTAKFTDARGDAGVTTEAELLTQNADGSFTVPVPREAMAYEGAAELTLIGETIEDETVTKRLTTKPLQLWVCASGADRTAQNTEPITATDKQQILAKVNIAEAYAKGTVDGVAVLPGQTGYHDNAKYYSELASQAKTAAESAQSAAETAQGKSEVAQTAAETAQGKAEDAQSSAEAAQSAAETAQGKAEDAQEAAETAQGKAEDAQAAAETAQGKAEDAQAAAETAQGKAEDAQSAAETAQGKAEDAQGAAETAQGKAEDAQSAAEAAQDAAETAQSATETAQGKAEDAQTAAETAQTAAESAQAAAEAILVDHVAAVYSASATYPVGAYVVYDNALYRAKVDITTAEAWTAAHWERISVGTALQQLGIAAGGIAVETYKGLQALVRAGLANYGLHPGDKLTAAWSEVARDFVVLGLDEDAPVETGRSHVLSLQMDRGIGILDFDPAQYLYAVTDNALPAGKYCIRLDHGEYYGSTSEDGTYWFETTQAIPVGGGIRHTTMGLQSSPYTQAKILGGSFITYGADRVTALDAALTTYPMLSFTAGGMTDVSIDEATFRNAVRDAAGVYAFSYDAANQRWLDWNSNIVNLSGYGISVTGTPNDFDEITVRIGTVLGTATAYDPQYKVGTNVNYTQRQMYGSNRWSTSYMRQYLNSRSASGWWEPKTIWSRPGSSMTSGFLYNLDPELVAVLGKVRKRYALPVSDGGGYEDVEDYVNLPTILDLGGTKNNNISEGPVNAVGTVTRTSRCSLWKGAESSAYVKKNSTGAINIVWWTGSTQVAASNTPRGDMVYQVSDAGHFDSGYHANRYTGSGYINRYFISNVYII